MMQKYPHLKLVESADEFHRNIWIGKEGLVVNEHSLFPDHCIVCNKMAKGRTVRKMLFWHNPLLLPVIFLSWPFYIVLALLFRRHISISIPLCQRHVWQRRVLTLLGGLLFPAAMTMIWMAVSSSQPPLILGAILSIIMGAMVIAWGRNPVWASQIQNGNAVIRGVSTDFIKGSNWDEWSEDEKRSRFFQPK